MYTLIYSTFSLFKSFFARLANGNAKHDEETLKAIQENTNGLRGIDVKLRGKKKKRDVFLHIDISGERLWVELKRIAEGRNAGPVLKTMLEQNTGQYLGIKLNFYFIDHS